MYSRETKHHSFEKVKAWQTSRKLRSNIYKISKVFPKEELYVLRQQIRRASISVHSNIAEGYGRYNFQENIQFCRIARGSLNEILDQLYVAFDEKYISKDIFIKLYEEGRNVEYDINCYIGFLKKQQKNY